MDRPGQQEVTGGTMRRTGPNDAFRVVWAIGEFFLMLFAFFITTNHVTGILKLRMYLREATMKRTGPNDAKHVVWAISEFFLYYSCFFITTNHVKGILKLWMYLREATTKRTGPERCETHRLGHW